MCINTGGFTFSNTCVLEKMATTKVSSEGGKSELLHSVLEILLIFLKLYNVLFTKIFIVQWKYGDHALCLTCHFFSTYWSSIQVPFSLWVLPDLPYENNCNFFTVPIVFDLLGHFWHSMAYSKSTFLPLRTGSKSSFIHSPSQLVNHSSSHLSIW